ncbi:liver-expressed antimicrobial peptide 2-like [Syngnathoides biaculeatus]|uniref:liver-expressed antimicrobial peptide 2-like n=1 Tax=Syngnathoides biaculeatus TaxID=300417 RepID=UPI002ADE035E|nr:liver-expressed antimicrobial peptide 2-like [Syngnathoides biaculeatus]
MRTLVPMVVVLSLVLVLLCSTQVDSLPVAEDWTGLVQRTKRSLLWRWNSMKPVGGSCREHMECGTNYCRKNICSFWKFT